MSIESIEAVDAQVAKITEKFPNFIKFLEKSKAKPKKGVEKQLLDKVRKNWEAIKDISDPNKALQRAAIERNLKAIEYIKNIDRDVLLYAIQRWDNSIKYIENLTEELKSLSLTYHPWNIRFIEEPSEELQLLAVGKAPESINHIENPSEKVQLLAVQCSYWAMRKIKKPTFQVCLNAISKCGLMLEYAKLYNFSEEEQLQLEWVAVKENGHAIQYVRPSSKRELSYFVMQNIKSLYLLRFIDINENEEFQLMAINFDDRAIAHIKNPAKRIQELALMKNFENIKYVEKTDENWRIAIEVAGRQNKLKTLFKSFVPENVQLLAVKMDINNIQYLKNPSAEVQLYVINTDESCIELIKNPCRQALEFLMKKYERINE